MMDQQCEHHEFNAEVTVNRLLDTGMSMADVRIACASCSEPFRFVGIPAGLSFDGPTVDVNGTELRTPIEPQSTPKPGSWGAAKAKLDKRGPEPRGYGVRVFSAASAARAHIVTTTDKDALLAEAAEILTAFGEREPGYLHGWNESGIQAINELVARINAAIGEATP